MDAHPVLSACCRVGHTDLPGFRIMGLIRPYYVHVPTSAVYEFPAITGLPIGTYNMTSGYVTVTNQAINQSVFGSGGYGNLSYGSLYRSLPVQGPYSAAALAMQGGRYPLTTMSVPNQYAYSSLYGLGNYG